MTGVGEVAWTVQRIGETVLVTIEDPEGTSEYALDLDDAVTLSALFVEAVAFDGPDELDELDEEVDP